MMQHAAQPRTTTAARYQPDGTRVRRITWFGVGIAGLVVVAMVVVHLLILALGVKPSQPDAPLYLDAPPPEPRLQADPLADLHALRARERAQLETYGWQDREAGVVRIPIERAMELLLEEAATERPPTEGGAR